MSERIIDPANPSVTTVLSVLDRPGLTWMKFNKPAELEEAASLGTLCHSIMAKYLQHFQNGKAIAARALLAPELAGLEARAPGRAGRMEWVFSWIDENVEKVIWIEGMIYDPKWKFHGHPDFAVFLKGDPIPWVVDAKFVEKIEPSYILQITAYSHLLEAELKIEDMNRGILQASEGGIKFKRAKRGTKKEHWNLFLYAMALYKEMPNLKI